jgi:hypothetical protein
MGQNYGQGPGWEQAGTTHAAGPWQNNGYISPQNSQAYLNQWDGRSNANIAPNTWLNKDQSVQAMQRAQTDYMAKMQDMYSRGMVSAPQMLTAQAMGDNEMLTANASQNFNGMSSNWLSQKNAMQYIPGYGKPFQLTSTPLGGGGDYSGGEEDSNPISPGLSGGVNGDPNSPLYNNGDFSTQRGGQVGKYFTADASGATGHFGPSFEHSAFDEGGGYSQAPGNWLPGMGEGQHYGIPDMQGSNGGPPLSNENQPSPNGSGGWYGDESHSLKDIPSNWGGQGTPVNKSRPYFGAFGGSNNFLSSAPEPYDPVEEFIQNPGQPKYQSKDGNGFFDAALGGQAELINKVFSHRFNSPYKGYS